MKKRIRQSSSDRISVRVCSFSPDRMILRTISRMQSLIIFLISLAILIGLGYYIWSAAATFSPIAWAVLGTVVVLVGVVGYSALCSLCGSGRVEIQRNEIKYEKNIFGVSKTTIFSAQECGKIQFIVTQPSQLWSSPASGELILPLIDGPVFVFNYSDHAAKALMDFFHKPIWKEIRTANGKFIEEKKLSWMAPLDPQSMAFESENLFIRNIADPLAKHWDWRPVRPNHGQLFASFTFYRKTNGDLALQTSLPTRLMALFFAIVALAFSVMLIIGGSLPLWTTICLIIITLFCFLGMVSLLHLPWICGRWKISSAENCFSRNFIMPEFNDELAFSWKISDIHALQLIDKEFLIIIPRGRTATYALSNCCELNAVSHNGERIHLQDGDYKRLSSNAAILAEAINVPIWDVSAKKLHPPEGSAK